MLQGKHSAIPSTCIKLPFVIKIFVLSIFEWLFYTGFTVFFSLKFDFDKATSADADEMVHDAAFYLVFTVLLKYPFRGVRSTKS